MKWKKYLYYCFQYNCINVILNIDLYLLKITLLVNIVKLDFTPFFWDILGTLCCRIH